MEHFTGLEDISMLNNVGSVTEEGPHLSDCEDTSVVDTEDTIVTSNEQTVYDRYEQPTDQAASANRTDVDFGVGKCIQLIKHTTSTFDMKCGEGVSEKMDKDDKLLEACEKLEESHTIEKEKEDGTLNKAAESIYIDDGLMNTKNVVRKVDPKPKRLTMAQRAAIEALASFGGCSLSSIPVRKIDLHSELEQEKRARKKRGLESGVGMCEVRSPPKKRLRTRLQTAKQEAEKAFENIALAEGPKKYSTLQKLKTTASQSSQRPVVKTRVTCVEKAKKEALKSFGGASLDSLPTKPSNTDSANVQNQDSSAGRRLTHVEQACVEAVQAFGGCGLQDVLTSSKKSISQHLKASKDVPAENGGGNKENVGGSVEHSPV